MEINIPLLKQSLRQWMTARSPVKVNTISFKEQMTATLSVTKTDTLLQRVDGCKWSGEINPSKKSHFLGSSSKKRAVLNK